MFKSFIILMLTLYSVAYADPQAMTPEQIRKDFEAQNQDKYRYDNLDFVQPNKLIEAGIVQANFTTTQANTTSINCNSLMAQGYTATLYSIDAISGTVQCMYAKKSTETSISSLYEPEGLFTVFYPQVKTNFALNTELAKQQNAAIIAQKDQMIQGLINTKNEIYQSITEAQGNYLNITQLITAGVLADPKIINAAATENTGKLQLQGDFTSAYSTAAGLTDNGYIISGEIINIFKNYSLISSKVLEYLVAMIIFIGIFTIGRFAISKLNKHDRSVAPLSFGATALIGFIAFLPLTSGSGNAPGQNQQDEFAIVDSNFQSLTRKGYYLFSDLADNLAKSITNTTLNTLLNKSGVGTSQQIVQSAAGMAQTEKLINYHTSLKTACTNTYNSELLDKAFGNPNTPYPSSERWAYAIATYQPSAGKNYYNKSPEGLVIGNATEGSYPQLSFSFCHRNDNLLAKYTKQHKDYQTSYNAARETDPNANQKIAILNNLVHFQYELYRSWGYLSILGLPVTMLQTEAAGRLYQKDDVTKKLQERISSSDETGGFLSAFVSSIPYMLVPGAGTIYGNTVGTLRDLGSGAKDSVLGKALGWFGGNVLSSIVTNTAGFTLSYTFVKILLSLLPITGIVIIGLLRFITIIIKMLVFHFGSLLIFPIIFAQNNSELLTKFTVKVLLLMVEIPVFVLSIWLSITANSLLRSVGDVFSKEIILGMLANNEAGRVKEWTLAGVFDMSDEFFEGLKIFLLYGFFEVVIGLFSIILIYKIIISLHAALFEGMELRGSQILDDAVASLRNEQNFAGKI